MVASSNSASTRQRAASDEAHSQAVEDYVKAIYLIRERGNDATGAAIAGRLDVSQASVTSMLQKLAALDLVAYVPYQPVTLTRRGTAVALEVIRHHRLLELFLHDALGMSWDEIHDEAEVLEHHISERLEERIADRLGNPQFDPHGDPIPTRDGQVPDRDSQPLTGIDPGTKVTIARVGVSDGERLRYLESLGLVPGAAVTVVDKAPFDGPLTVSSTTNSEPVAIAFELASTVEVTT